MDLPPSPTFIMIGPGRTGSSWMYEMLQQHPEVCLARNTKETLFFERAYDKGLEWYLEFFRHCDPGHAIGELSTTYFRDPEVPERIHHHFPRIRLIACLRDPMERTLSAYYYRKRAGETVVGFEEALKEESDLIEESFYDQHLEDFLRYFPRESLHLLFYEDLQEDPKRFLRQLYEAVGVATDRIPEGVGEKVNQRSEERIPGSGRLLGMGSRFLRKMGAYRTLDRVKRNKAVRKILLKEKDREGRPRISPETERWLNERFQRATEWVEDFTGRDLETWKRPYHG